MLLNILRYTGQSPTTKIDLVYKEDPKKWKAIPCSWTERINIVKMSYYLKQYTASVQSLLKYPWNSSQN